MRTGNDIAACRPLLRGVLGAGLTLVAAQCAAFVPAGSDANSSRWSNTASGSTGQAGDPITLTWGIIRDGTGVRELQPNGELSLTTNPSTLIADFDAAFGAGPGGNDLTQRPWFTYFEQSFDRWTALTGVTYLYEPNDTPIVHGSGSGILGVRPDVRIGGISLDGSGGTLAYNFFPSGGGDMALDTDDLASLFTDPTGNFRRLRNTIMHEAGHGLGLEHVSSGDANFLMEASINASFDGPQHDDLRGIHWFYGDALEKASPAGRNDTFALATDLGSVQAGQSVVIGAGGSGAAVGGNETDFVSITNENDLDYFSFEISSSQTIDLSMTPRGATYNQGAQQFITTQTNDLSLALFAGDGQTLIAQSASGAAGVPEVLDDVLLATPGEYFVRVRSQAPSPGQVTQFYELALTATATGPALPGDFSGDGVVDAIDYAVWREDEGLLVSAFSGSDHDGSGQVDEGDYDLWRTNYGATLSAVAQSVPEPAGAWIVASIGVWNSSRTGRRR